MLLMLAISVLCGTWSVAQGRYTSGLIPSKSALNLSQGQTKNPMANPSNPTAWQQSYSILMSQV